MRIDPFPSVHANCVDSAAASVCRARTFALTDAVAANDLARRPHVSELVDTLVSGTGGGERIWRAPD
jgi:hypothetical protein